MMTCDGVFLFEREKEGREMKRQRKMSWRTKSCKEMMTIWKLMMGFGATALNGSLYLHHGLESVCVQKPPASSVSEAIYFALPFLLLLKQTETWRRNHKT